MSDLIEDAGPGQNAHEYTVSEISGAVKRVLEGEFGYVRVRAEVGRVSRPRSGHLYFDLKDDRAVLNAVSWKGQVARMAVQPEEGMEVIATGRMTTFPGGSRYQLIVDNVEPAGEGALMAMLEKRKKALAADGLFAPERKQPLPFLPEVIGVVTSPSGAVIRDILHRLRDRFPRKVLVWPVAVQGQNCAAEVARAIEGFNALTPGGALPRPDLIIVARGGGSIEDLWGFNEEIVVRAAAASDIPLISAVGHETDTTLIDFAADRRAPTPTAAAEMAVPVRLELLGWVDDQGARMTRGMGQAVLLRRQRLADLSRALPRPEQLVEGARQRLDKWGDRLDPALRAATQRRRVKLAEAAAHLRPGLLRNAITAKRDRLEARISRLRPEALTRDITQKRRDLDQVAARLAAVARADLGQRRDRLAALERMRMSLGYEETLARGYAVVRSGEQVITTRVAAEAATALEIQFRDGRFAVGGKPAKKAMPKKPPEQGSLF
ncbi:exodeoxyribonuclease VII large subunit [Actibacterium sp. XHP0104]|uniref:exodeoxyribonuclease VII large subunit n=1 Tax=Actibacterium sp. XHP0104 TaxID=2984335 RepID=UPI0021E6EE05|nr:exodeoxyribonuclease VII large subunit [Actibacterium sp. XHP0104]MCV2882575.1 exodeoxyribonuclease VII large subunit [Actibacterium sp. XHP0104]